MWEVISFIHSFWDIVRSFELERVREKSSWGSSLLEPLLRWLPHAVRADCKKFSRALLPFVSIALPRAAHVPGCASVKSPFEDCISCTGGIGSPRACFEATNESYTALLHCRLMGGYTISTTHFTGTRLPRGRSPSQTSYQLVACHKT